jgi:hypothetical protein
MIKSRQGDFENKAQMHMRKRRKETEKKIKNKKNLKKGKECTE